MFAAFNILFCLLVPGLFALVAVAISLAALRRHTTFRQFVFAAFVLVATVSSVSALYQSLYTGQTISALPLLLIGFTFVFASGQLVVASILGAVTRPASKDGVVPRGARTRHVTCQ